MKTAFYLKVNRNGSISTSKGKPYLDHDQVAVRLSLDLPDSLFVKPQITANIVIDETQVRPIDISAETINNVQDAIEQSTGLNVVLRVEPESVTTI